MSRYNTKATKDLHIHKKFSSIDLTGGSDCTSKHWNVMVDGKVKGGVLVNGEIYANIMENLGNTIVHGNLTGKTVNGKLIGSYVTDSYTYTGEYTGKINGSLTCNSDVIVVGLISPETLEIRQTPFQGNCITSKYADTVVGVFNSDFIQSNVKFTMDGITVAEMTNDYSWQTNYGEALGKYSYADNNAKCNGNFNHAEGINTNIKYANYSHVEGGYNTINNTMCDTTITSNTNELIYISNKNNHVNTTNGTNGTNETNETNETNGTPIMTCKSWCKNVYVCGLSNKIYNSENCNVHGESNKLVNITHSHIYGFSHLIENSNKVHVEGFGNLIKKTKNSHVEGMYNTINNCNTTHIEGEYNQITNVSECHVEGSHITTISTINPMEQVWAGGLESKINQSYEWVRSAGKIKVPGDAQTGMYVLYGIQDVNQRNCIFSLNSVSKSEKIVGLKLTGVHYYEFKVVGTVLSKETSIYTSTLYALVSRNPKDKSYNIQFEKQNENNIGKLKSVNVSVSVKNLNETCESFEELLVDFPEFSLCVSIDLDINAQIKWVSSAISTQLTC